MFKKTFDQIQKYLNSFYLSLLDFLENAYPIDFSKFKKTQLLVNSLSNLPINLKIFLLVSVSGLLVSFFLLASGVYLLFTEILPASGGEINEIVLNGTIERLNPVLEYANETEKKINSLLYAPLYEVKYPDYLSANSIIKPKIEPILLEKEPVWQNDDRDTTNNYKILNFKLRSGLKWCDNSSPITVDDIIYSFNRLKEEGGNQDFYKVLQNYEIKAVGNNNEFVIQVAKSDVLPNPGLIFNLNFQPISQKFYQNQKNNDLKSSPRSKQPIMSSGLYCFPTKITNPDNGKNTVDNPYKPELEDYTAVVLDRNANSPYIKSAYVQKYIFRFTKNIKEVSISQPSLEGYIKNNKFDIYNRFLVPQSSSLKFSDYSDLKSKIVNTNTYFSVYLNVQNSNEIIDGFLINQTLRKYIICNLIKFEVPKNILELVYSIPENKRLLPIQLYSEYTPNCDNIQNQLLELKNPRGSNIYSIEEDQQNNLRRIKVFGQSIVLKFLNLKEFGDYANFVKNAFLDMGLPVESIEIEASQLEQKLLEKNYHLVFLPVNIQSQNLYSLFGNETVDILNLSKNERINGRNVEVQLKNYSNSDLQDKESYNQILETFKNEFLMINLFRGRQEIFFSNKIYDIDKNLPDSINQTSDLYSKSSFWYLNTERKFKY